MTGTLKVTPERLKITSGEFRSQSSSIRSLTCQMLQIVRSLNGSWEGDAQKAYARKFNALDTDMNQIKRKIDEHVRDLNDMADTYKKAESTNQTKFNSLSSNYIED